MKRQVLFLATMIVCVSFSFAQVLKINQMELNDSWERIFVKEIQHGEIIGMDTDKDYITFDSDVINTSNITRTVSLKLEVFEPTDGVDISACWFECPEPWNFRFNPVELPSEGSEICKVTLETKGISGSKAWITCTFLIDDEVDFVFHIKFGDAETSVNEPVISKSKAFPNPASSVVNIDYALNRNFAKIALYNILGAMVYEQTLPNQEGTAIIDVFDLPQGIYFYAIKVDGKALETKKLIISR